MQNSSSMQSQLSEVGSFGLVWVCLGQYSHQRTCFCLILFWDSPFSLWHCTASSITDTPSCLIGHDRHQNHLFHSCEAETHIGMSARSTAAKRHLSHTFAKPLTLLSAVRQKASLSRQAGDALWNTQQQPWNCLRKPLSPPCVAKGSRAGAKPVGEPG